MRATVAVSKDTPPPVPTLWEDGSITGPWPCTFPLAWRAAHGPSVYMLIDTDDRIAYVGQTGDLVQRLQRHGRNKAFVRWESMRPPEGLTALELEAMLIYAYKPYLYNDGTVRSW